MALNRKVLDNVRFVYPRDPAIDAEKSNLEKYKELFEEKYLTFKENEKPTVFVIKQLTTRQKIERENFSNDMERLMFIIRCGLVAIENYIVYDENDNQSTLNSIDREDKGKLGSLITQSWLEKANFPDEHIGAMAGAILNISSAQVPLS